MEYKNDFAARLMSLRHIQLSSKFVLRFFVIATVALAILAGLGWEMYSGLSRKYAVLDAKHDRLNRIYLQERKVNNNALE